MSMDTLVHGAKTARPAPSAAGSIGSGGHPVSGIKITLRGAASAHPAASQGSIEADLCLHGKPVFFDATACRPFSCFESHYRRDDY